MQIYQSGRNLQNNACIISSLRHLEAEGKRAWKRGLHKERFDVCVTVRRGSISPSYHQIPHLPVMVCLPVVLGLFMQFAISSLKIRISMVISSLFWHLLIWFMNVSWCALPTLSTTAWATPVKLFWHWSSSVTRRMTSKLELSVGVASSIDL